MDIRKLQRAIVDGLEDVKAQNIVIFNTEHLSALFERVIVASGTSNRQTKALASSVRETVKARGWPVLSVEGADNGEWIIVDCGAAVAHIMQPAIRDYYRLEEIWGGKAVRMKIDNSAPRTGPLPDDDESRPRPGSAPRKRAASGAAARTPSAGPSRKPSRAPEREPVKASPRKQSATVARKQATTAGRKQGTKAARTQGTTPTRTQSTTPTRTQGSASARTPSAAPARKHGAPRKAGSAARKGGPRSR